MEDQSLRFIIQVDDVYYITTSDFLIYDPAKAGDGEEREGVMKVAEKFKEIADNPDNRCRAVKLTDDAFSCTNVNRDDKDR